MKREKLLLTWPLQKNILKSLKLSTRGKRRTKRKQKKKGEKRKKEKETMQFYI